MMKLVRCVILVATLLFMAIPAFAAPGDRSSDGLWKEIAEFELIAAGDAKLVSRVVSYGAFEIDLQAMRDLLRNAPVRLSSDARREEVVISLPMPDGSYRRFRVEEAPVLAPGLAARYPEIKSYRVLKIDGPSEVGSATHSPSGMRVAIRTPEGTVEIRPYSGLDSSRHISYIDVGDSGQSGPCGIEDPVLLFSEKDDGNGPMAPLDTPAEVEYRVFRLAVAATHEYAKDLMNPPDAEFTYDEIVYTVGRLNEIYERDLAVHLQLESGSELVFLTQDAVVGSCAPLDNSIDACDSGELRGIAHCVIQHVMGEYGIEYDIGHLFALYEGSGPGGCANDGVACNVYSKGKALTKFGPSQLPVTDKSLRLVAHEMGHQFSSPHTYSYTGDDCPSGYSNLVEPGSGSTIMGYRINCEGQRVVADDDEILYFHINSIEEIVAELESLPLPAEGCGLDPHGEIFPVTNLHPEVDPLTDLTIPRSTPFVLAGTASDDGPQENLRYTWEQNNFPGGFRSSPFEDDPGPDAIFRSYFPGTEEERTFVQTNPVLPGEILPTLDTYDLPDDQTKMRFVVRDGSGGVASAEMKIPVQGAPLRVLPYLGENTDGTMSIVWDPGDSAVLSPKVQILQLAQGEVSFAPLVSCTDNDGMERVPSAGCNMFGPRIKIRSLGPDCLDCGDAACDPPAGSYFFSDSNVPLHVFCACPTMRSCGPCMRDNCITYDTGMDRCWDGSNIVRCGEGDSVRVTTCECIRPARPLGDGNVIIMPTCDNDTSLGWSCSSSWSRP